MKTLLTESQIQSHVLRIAHKIDADYYGKTLTALVLLKGGFVFAADLLRHVTVPVKVEFMEVSSYSNDHTGHDVVFTFFDWAKIFNEDVLIIDDILDTGNTLFTITQKVKESATKSYKTCCLLRKPGKCIFAVDLDYPAIKIPNFFVFGYGMDDKGLKRNLKEIRY